MSATISQEAISERKALHRALEDYQENLLAMQIESALLDKAIEGTEELANLELERNVRAKQKIQEMTDVADEDKAKADRFFEMTLMLNKGILSRVARLAAAKLKEVKEATKLRKEDLEQKLSDQIDDFVKDHRPGSVKKVRQMEIDVVKGRRTLNENAEKIDFLRSSRRSARQMSDGTFQLMVVDLATCMLRYQDLVNRLINPSAHKVARGRQMRMLMPMHISRLPSPVVLSVAGGNESNEVMPRIASSSKFQERLDTDEDPNAMSGEPAAVDPNTEDNDKAFNRNSLSRAALRLKKSAANTVQRDETENTKRSKTPKPATAQSFIAQTARYETKENNVFASEELKRALPNPSPFKLPAEQSHFLRKTRKSKVTFVNVQLSASGCQVDFSNDEGVSSSDFNVVAADAMSDKISPDHGNAISFDENDISSEDENEISPDDENEAQTKNDDDGMLLDMDDDQISDWASLDPNEMDVGVQSPISNFGDSFMGTDATENNGFEQTTRRPQAETETNQPADNDEFVFDFDAADLAEDFF